MSNELVSIIVPVYNTEKYVERCIKSICNQTYKNIELLIIDDGSTDNSGKICDKWAEKDIRVKVIHEENRGVSIARNRGIELSQGDYIGFVDSDDVIDEHMYENMLEEAHKGNYDIICCNGYFMYSGEEKKIIISNYESKELECKNYMLFSIQNGGYVCNRIYKKTCIKNIEFRKDIYILEDLLFNMEISEKCKKIKYINNPLYFYYINSNSALREKTTFRNVYKRVSALTAKEEIIKICEKHCLDIINQLKMEYVFNAYRLRYIYKYIDNYTQNVAKKYINQKIFFKKSNLFYKLKTMLIVYFPKMYVFLKRKELR